MKSNFKIYKGMIETVIGHSIVATKVGKQGNNASHSSTSSLYD
jgi:hypothetical protein